MTVSGIDVASYQSTDYNTAGLTFVMVKATEGTGYVNPHRAGQVATGRTHGLVVGHYHFARPGNLVDQAEFFRRTAAPRPGDVLCLDWEDAGVSSDWKDAWIRHVQAAAPGHRVILYCNRDFWINRDYTNFAGDGLWIADPGVAAGRPRVEHPWLMHQYSEAGGIDHNVANFPTAAALRAWAAGTTPKPQEDDVPLTDAEIEKIAERTRDLILTYRNKTADAASMEATGQHIPDFYGYTVDTSKAVAKLPAAQIDYTKLAAALIAQLKGA